MLYVQRGGVRRATFQTPPYIILNPLHKEHVLFAKVTNNVPKLLPLSQQTLIGGQRAANVTQSEFNARACSKFPSKVYEIPIKWLNAHSSQLGGGIFVSQSRHFCFFVDLSNMQMWMWITPTVGHCGWWAWAVTLSGHPECHKIAHFNIQ